MEQAVPAGARREAARREGLRVARLLGLSPLPEEGGLFRATHADELCTAIYYLLIAPDFSALHRLPAAETYHFYSGSPLRLTVIHPDGAVDTPILGPNLAAGQRPQIRVPAMAWQGSATMGAWTLAGTTMCPGFDWKEFTLGDRDELAHTFPHAARRITELTRARSAGA